jgi:hypothetical protein
VSVRWSINSVREAPRVGSNSPAAMPPTWDQWPEIGRVVFYPPYLKKTARLALIVGSILFAINHLDEVLRGQATYAVWIKGAITYLVPFCVANLGVLIATRRE